MNVEKRKDMTIKENIFSKSSSFSGPSPIQSSRRDFLEWKSLLSSGFSLEGMASFVATFDGKNSKFQV